MSSTASGAFEVEMPSVYAIPIPVVVTTTPPSPSTTNTQRLDHFWGASITPKILSNPRNLFNAMNMNIIRTAPYPHNSPSLHEDRTTLAEVPPTPQLQNDTDFSAHRAFQSLGSGFYCCRANGRHAEVHLWGPHSPPLLAVAAIFLFQIPLTIPPATLAPCTAQPILLASNRHNDFAGTLKSVWIKVIHMYTEFKQPMSGASPRPATFLLSDEFCARHIYRLPFSWIKTAVKDKDGMCWQGVVTSIGD